MGKLYSGKRKEDFKCVVWRLMECRAGGGHLKGLVLGSYSTFSVFPELELGSDNT